MLELDFIVLSGIFKQNNQNNGFE